MDQPLAITRLIRANATFFSSCSLLIEKGDLTNLTTAAAMSRKKVWNARLASIWKAWIGKLNYSWPFISVHHHQHHHWLYQHQQYHEIKNFTYWWNLLPGGNKGKLSLTNKSFHQIKVRMAFQRMDCMMRNQKDLCKIKTLKLIQFISKGMLLPKTSLVHLNQSIALNKNLWTLKAKTKSSQR